MKVLNVSQITYTLNNTTVQTNSNKIMVNLIVPIIFFMKCNYENTVKVVIKNSSGLTINNVMYKDVSINEFNYIQGTLRVNNCCINDNPALGICLGKMMNNEVVIMSYKITESVFNNCAAVLTYNYYINKKRVGVYLLSHCKRIKLNELYY